ncbi:hypothetical protein L198_02843 [Cryptococcus wingfieldii CBS 7118]|uniref:Uncharacterized protein n=1 Tax=Cryptococcus wingfieldii CBS 7118 TaxID=1295528 RepID=A0A1E3JI08_9TREE|nr:hypothetical protein L198_02843 [Cryptococcus wingfieldii CBS 7118]ODO00524.1 hypothetical protein L198_02843 [Cryptococcus wingfieldii CBS 7118]
MAILHPETATRAPDPPPLVRRPTSSQINTYNPRKDLPPSLKKGGYHRHNDNYVWWRPYGLPLPMFSPNMVLPPAEKSTTWKDLRLITFEQKGSSTWYTEYPNTRRAMEAAYIR